MKQYYIGDIPMSIWPNIVAWMVATLEPGTYGLIDDCTLATTEENFTLLCLRWA